MIKDIIFIAGIHGVGKSGLADYLGGKLNLPCYSASSLIRKEKNKPVDSSKCVLDPKDNQDYLVKAVCNLEVDKKAIVLDGHFVLIAPDGFFTVPLSTFESLPIKMIFLKILDERVIRNRLVLRDGVAPEIEVLEELQIREVERAREISESLNVRLVIVESENYEDIEVDFELDIGVL